MVLLDLPVVPLLVFLFLLGCIVGSFLNVCVHRLPHHEEVRPALRALWKPASRCPRCGTRIRWFDNIPVFSWIWLGGRCRACRGWISVQYPAVELMNGLLFVLVYWLEVPWGSGGLAESTVQSSIGPQGVAGSTFLAPTALLHWRYLYHMVLFEALIVASLIDLKFRIIPDGVTLPAMAVGVVGAAAAGRLYLVPVWYQDPSTANSLRLILPEWLTPLFQGPTVPAWIESYPHLHGLAVSLAGLAVGGALIWAVRLIGYWVLRREAMGFGDVILMAMIGSFVGWQAVVVVFFAAPMIAFVVALVSLAVWRRTEIPYGPYLSLATVLVVLNWKDVWLAWDGFFGLGAVLIALAAFMAVMLFGSLCLVQLAKRLMGIPLYADEWVEEWTSADQLAHFEGENADLYQGRWRGNGWAGTESGRGTAMHETWRHGSGNGWHQYWSRRQTNQ